MARHGTWLALPLLALLAAGCHVIFPFDVSPPDGGTGSDLPAVVDLAPRPELRPIVDSASRESAPPLDVWTAETGSDDLEPPPNDLPPPTCSPLTLLSGAVSNAGWVIDGTANADTNNITFVIDQETSALLTPAKAINVPKGCGLKVKVSGSFSKGELYFMLYPNACWSVATCGTGPKPESCSLKPDVSGTGYSCIIPPLPTPRTFQTIRIRRPAGTMVGSAKVSYFWLYAQ